MAIAARPKPPSHYKKRSGQHHRQSQPYLKTYWPYLPMAAILTSGAIINATWAVAAAAPSQASETRVQALSGIDAAWLPAVVLVIAGVALIWFVVHHTLAFHRLLIRGEHFINDHPLLDIAAVFIFTAGFVLTRTSGLIR